MILCDILLFLPISSINKKTKDFDELGRVSAKGRAVANNPCVI